MREPSPQTSRLAIAGGIAAAIAVASAGFFAGRSSVPPSKAPAQVAAPEPSPSPTRRSTKIVALDRAGLLRLAGQAVDAVGSNSALPAQVASSAGRRFDLILPFGCEGPSEPNSSGAMRWHYDAKGETLRIAVDPVAWRVEDWGLNDAPGRDRALRGFWVGRPWSSATTCSGFRRPSPQTGSEPVVLPGQSLAVAQRVDADKATRMRSFELVKRVAPEDIDPALGFQLRLVGRLEALAGPNPLRCLQPGGSEQRPLCLITASFVELRVENPKDGSVLATWPIGDDARAGE